MFPALFPHSFSFFRSAQILRLISMAARILSSTVHWDFTPGNHVPFLPVQAKAQTAAVPDCPVVVLHQEEEMPQILFRPWAALGSGVSPASCGNVHFRYACAVYPEFGIISVISKNRLSRKSVCNAIKARLPAQNFRDKILR